MLIHIYHFWINDKGIKSIIDECECIIGKKMNFYLKLNILIIFGKLFLKEIESYYHIVKPSDPKSCLNLLIKE